MVLLNDHGHRDSYRVRCDCCPPPQRRTGESISRDAMCRSEIEMLSLKLVVREICRLQNDKNATKQATEGEKKSEELFLESGLTS